MAGAEPRFRIDFYRAWQIFRKREIDPVALREALPRAKLSAWLGLLIDGRYLVVGEEGYRLIRDSGQMPPLIRMDGSLYDPNLSGPVERWQQRAWNALRISSPLPLSAIATWAERSEMGAYDYLLALKKTGFCQSRGDLWICHSRVPYAPVLISERGIRRIFDPNSGHYAENFMQERRERRGSGFCL
jgi:hypothetical protein